MQHIKRWITALILIPILLWIIIKGNAFLFSVLVAIVSISAFHEYLKIIFGKDEESISNTIKAISYTVSTAIIFSAYRGSWEMLFLVLALNLMALSIFVLSGFVANHSIFDIISKQILGVFYIPVSLSLLIFIKGLDGGIFWIIWLLIVIFANDTGAFYSGTFLGKNALAPNISPNKTIEGSLGGMAASMATGFIFCQYFFNDLSLSFIVLPMSFILAIAGQIGDLFESAMKRASSIKESGRILPGHGGMLDRIDGLLLAIPVLYGCLVFLL